MINLDYHDTYWENAEHKIPRMDPHAFLKRALCGDEARRRHRRDRPCRQPRTATRERRSRSSTASTPMWSRPTSSAPALSLPERSDLLRNPADDHSLLVFDPKIRGKTDRVVLKFKKPR